VYFLGDTCSDENGVASEVGAQLYTCIYLVTLTVYICIYIR